MRDFAPSIEARQARVIIVPRSRRRRVPFAVRDWDPRTIFLCGIILGALLGWGGAPFVDRALGIREPAAVVAEG